MREVIATNKLSGRRELVILGAGMRLFTNADEDPETVVVFATGERVAYKEELKHFLWRRSTDAESKTHHRIEERLADDGS